MKMRVNAIQLEKMVSFMEKHGDLSKPSNGLQERLTNIQLWSELVNLLNGVSKSNSKSGGKWRKTWSDLKNNTKKKLAKLSRARSSPGDGPIPRAKLSDIEERVLALINPEANTEMTEMSETGLVEAVLNTDSEQDPLEQSAKGDGHAQGDWNEAESSHASESCSHPSQNVQPNSYLPQPTVTASNRRRLRNRGLPTRLLSRRGRFATIPLSDSIRLALVNSLLESRRFRMKTEKRNQELERERLRLREIELKQHAKWQEMFGQFLSVIETVTKSVLNRDT